MRARPGTRQRLAAALVAGGLALTGCGSLGLPVPPDEGTATAEPAGPLVVGLMTSTAGTAGRFSPLVRYGVAEALDDANEADGLFGSDVELVEVEPDTPPADAVATLADAGVTVVVTALPGETLAELVPLAAEQAITVLETRARSSGLDGISDAGHMFRLLATDTTVRPWLVDEVLGAGGRLAYVARDNAAAQARADRLGPALATAGGELVSTTLYPDGTEDFAAASAAALDAGATMVLVDGGAETGQVLAALTAEIDRREARAEDAPHGAPAQDTIAPAILIGADGTDSYGDALAADALRGATAIRPAAPPSDDFVNRILNRDVTLTGFPYAAPAFDAAAVAVLAAGEAGAADGARVAQHVSTTLTGGQECTELETCLDLVTAGTDIDYRGRSGNLELGTDGEPVAAEISTYGFTAGNMLEGASPVAVERAG